MYSTLLLKISPTGFETSVAISWIWFVFGLCSESLQEPPVEWFPSDIFASFIASVLLWLLFGLCVWMHAGMHYFLPETCLRESEFRGIDRWTKKRLGWDKRGKGSQSIRDISVLPCWSCRCLLFIACSVFFCFTVSWHKKNMWWLTKGIIIHLTIFIIFLPI